MCNQIIYIVALKSLTAVNTWHEIVELATYAKENTVTIVPKGNNYFSVLDPVPAARNYAQELGISMAAAGDLAMSLVSQ